LLYHFFTLSVHDEITFFFNLSITSYGHCYGLSEVQIIYSSFYILVYDWSGWCRFWPLRRPKDPFLCSVASLWLLDHIRVVRVWRVIVKTSCLHTTNLKEAKLLKKLKLLLNSAWSEFKAFWSGEIKVHMAVLMHTLVCVFIGFRATYFWKGLVIGNAQTPP